VLAPILVHVRGVRWPALTIAVAVLVLALAGVLDSDIFGYRVMPGILLFFVSGVLLYEARRHVLVARRVVIGLALVAGIGGLGLWLTHHMPWLGHEIIGGYLLGLSGVSILARLRPHRLDDLIGGAAYGTFLAHWLVIWLLGRFAIFTDNPGLAQVAVVVGAVALGVTGYLLFERPVTSIRHRLRRRASRSASPAVSVVTSKREPEGVPA
jgi:peptidoglycan/LPS O-acetylase OafA/YrhL